MRWPRARHGAAWAIPAALAIDAIGTGLYLPLSMVYFLTVTDLSESGVGLLLTAATACSLLLPLLVGRLVDRIGPRPVVIAGQLLQAAGFFLYLGVAGPVSLFLAAMVEAVGLRVYWSSVFALIAEQADGEDRDQWFARAGMIRAAGTGAGTVLAGGLLALGSQHAYRGMVLADAFSFLVAAVTVALFVRGARRPAGRPDGESSDGGVRELLRNRPYLWLIGVNVLFNICTVFLAVALPVYMIRGLHVPGWAVGAFLTITTAVVATCTAEVTRRSRRRTTRGGAMAWGGRLWAAWCAAAAMAVLLPRGPLLVGYLALVMLLWATAEMLHGPASNALSAEAAPEGRRGTYLAAFQYSFATADMVTPALFGVLYGVNRVLPWVAVGCLALTASVAIRPLERRLTDDGAARGSTARTAGATPARRTSAADRN
ncbi:MFS transporter [Streptomyces sp. ME19-01-6]|uniref:MFS transporter n=1 Tax=Streptomyces sp. ME19-01-6 TaxID=3028686 RepID=UPI0029A2DA8B|nr:MFS transporter [Streptomyces sp. ME19-01-6]MDX3225051.1 MFS transporter [Streptomyces sp. ME19-01-6]